MYTMSQGSDELDDTTGKSSFERDSQIPRSAEPIQHGCNRDCIHYRRMRLKYNMVRRSSDGSNDVDLTTVPAPALRRKCNSPYTSPIWYLVLLVGRKNAMTSPPESCNCHTR